VKETYFTVTECVKLYFSLRNKKTQIIFKMEKWWRRRENYLIAPAISLLLFELDKMLKMPLIDKVAPNIRQKPKKNQLYCYQKI
jgi:hypothetical protein